MKKILHFCLALVFSTAFLFSQNEDLQTFESYDFQIETVLIDDRSLQSHLKREKLKSVIELDRKFILSTYRRDYNFDVSQLNLSPPKLMLQKRTDFDSADNILMLCGGLENGLYRNFNSGDIILGAGIDHFINDILLKDLLNFKLGKGRKH